ncbi:hypothetical protein T484DRAFT_1817954 [Baffinella frigidus]|nr:hypothetical protein T484DRAFT_1817954 [Cryptophyta sp. CCMP2293]
MRAASPRLAASPVISLPSPPLLNTPHPDDIFIPTFPVSFMVPGSGGNAVSAFLLNTPHPNDIEIPTFPVSFMVPGYHPIVGLSATVALASPLTALSGTQTEIVTSVDEATGQTVTSITATTGQVTLVLHGISSEEAAREGKFYFLKLNCTSGSGGAMVQADFLIRILLPGDSMPNMAFAHSSLSNLPFATNASGTDPARDGVDLASAVPRFYPEGSYVAYVGFEVNYTLSAQDPTPTDAVGFSVQGLPEYARMTTVRGKNPVQMTTYWVPCSVQDGRHIICYEAADDKGVDAGGNASTPECVDISVLPDPAPQFAPPIDDGRDMSFAPPIDDGRFAPPIDDGRVANMSVDVIVTMGATKVYTVSAYDVNCLDSLTLSLSPLTPLPAGAALSPQVSAASTVACERRSPDQTVSATLSWEAPHTFGGSVHQLCFRASDSCGECNCAGGADTTEVCVTFRVAKCRYSIGQEHELAEVARLYNTDWLQMWKMNVDIKHPDYILFSGQARTTVDALFDLNMDLGRDPSLPVGYEVCVLPNSCVGQAQSALPAGSEYRAYQCAGRLNTNGALFSTLEDCRAQCVRCEP